MVSRYFFSLNFSILILLYSTDKVMNIQFWKTFIIYWEIYTNLFRVLLHILFLMGYFIRSWRASACSYYPKFAVDIVFLCSEIHIRSKLNSNIPSVCLLLTICLRSTSIKQLFIFRLVFYSCRPFTQYEKCIYLNDS